MGLPKAAEAQRYYRAARQRFEDAQYLLRAHRTTGAVYLAGYSVECSLKALVLAGVARGLRQRVLGEFRGSRAHNLEWLSSLYHRHVRFAVPDDVRRHLLRATSWSTALRYATGVIHRRDAEAFLGSVAFIMAWADGRM
jgi:HEPN domain-containing protein